MSKCHSIRRETQDGPVWDVYRGEERISAGWSQRLAGQIVAEQNDALEAILEADTDATA